MVPARAKTPHCDWVCGTEDRMRIACLRCALGGYCKQGFFPPRSVVPLQLAMKAVVSRTLFQALSRRFLRFLRLGRLPATSRVGWCLLLLLSSLYVVVGVVFVVAIVRRRLLLIFLFFFFRLVKLLGR